MNEHTKDIKRSGISEDNYEMQLINYTEVLDSNRFFIGDPNGLGKTIFYKDTLLSLDKNMIVGMHEGFLENGNYHGIGIMSWADGDVIAGIWYHGKLHCQIYRYFRENFLSKRKERDEHASILLDLKKFRL